MVRTLKTKSFWVGLGTVVYGVTLIAQGNVEVGIPTVMGGLAVMAGRDAISKIEK